MGLKLTSAKVEVEVEAELGEIKKMREIAANKQKDKQKTPGEYKCKGIEGLLRSVENSESKAKVFL